MENERKCPERKRKEANKKTALILTPTHTQYTKLLTGQLCFRTQMKIANQKKYTKYAFVCIFSATNDTSAYTKPEVKEPNSSGENIREAPSHRTQNETK